MPDRRIVLMNEQFDLADKHVLEVGCFEGIHTVSLAMLARKVTALDARMENVVKTIVRSAMFGFTPTRANYSLCAGRRSISTPPPCAWNQGPRKMMRAACSLSVSTLSWPRSYRRNAHGSPPSSARPAQSSRRCFTGTGSRSNISDPPGSKPAATRESPA